MDIGLVGLGLGLVLKIMVRFRFMSGIRRVATALQSKEYQNN